MTSPDNDKPGKGATPRPGPVAGARPGTSRRDFLKMAGGLGLAAGVVTVSPSAAWAAKDFHARRSAAATATLAVAINAGSPSAGQKAVAAEFEKMTGSKVVYEAYPAVDWNGFFAKVLTQLAAGVELDCAYVATEGTQLFAHSGLSMPLDSYVMRDKAELKPYFEDVHPLSDRMRDVPGQPDDVANGVQRRGHVL